MSSHKQTPLSTPVRKRTPHQVTKSGDSTKVPDENLKPGGTPLSHLKMNIKTAVSPKTPFSAHNRLIKSPARSVPRAAKNVSSAPIIRPSILKSKGTAAPTTPKQASSKSRPTTPTASKMFKSPSRCNTPLKVENSVLVPFSRDILSSSECITPSRPAQLLSEASPNMFDRLNRSHSASSLFHLKKKDEETPKAALKRSLSEAKLSLNSSMEPEGEKSSLTVGVRVRPLQPREGMNSIHVDDGEIKVASDLGSEHSFIYDHCFSTTASQKEVYEALVRPLLDNAFQGYNACLFAYGQTGSGKTYSMMGPFSEDEDADDPCIRTESGMIPRFCAELLERKAVLEEANPSFTMTVKVSYLEVYNEKIHDLLVPGNTQLRVREHPVYGPYVVDLSQHSVNSFQEFQHWMWIGNKKRAVAATEHNDKSSRSHSLFTVKLTQSFAQVRSDGSWSHDQTRRSQINLVDLAGSERIANSAVSSDRLREGVSINRSLLTLGKVMSALVEKRGFVPYRESVLTWLLKESLGGNSRTCMLATISPCSNHMDESLSTLRYASQARSIVNRVRVNEAPQDREIRLLREEVERLRGAGERIDTLLGENEHLQEKLKNNEEVNKELEEELNKCKAELSKSEEMKLQLLKEISDLSSVVYESTAAPSDEISKYECELKSYKEKVISIEEECFKLKQELHCQNSIVNEKQLHLQEGLKEISSLNEQIKNLKEELKRKNKALEEATESNTALKGSVESKDLQIFSINKKIKENDQRISDLETDLRNLQDEFRKSEYTLAETKEINADLIKKAEEFSIREEILKQDLSQVPALESALNDFESELRKCKDDLYEARKTKDDLESCKKELEDKLHDITNKLSESNEREELLKVKLEKIPALESELRLAQAEARKAQRELEEYLSQSTDSDDSGELNVTLSGNRRVLNDSLLLPVSTVTKDMASQTTSDLKADEVTKLKAELELCKNQLEEAEKQNEILTGKVADLLADKEINYAYAKNCSNELFQHQENIIDLQEKLEEYKKAEEKLAAREEKISSLENEITRLKGKLEDEKLHKVSLEDKLSELSATVRHLKLKADNAVHYEIELGKCREELQKIQSSQAKELCESRSREEVLKAELALKNRQMEHLQNQLATSQEMQKNIVQENLGLIRVMKKKCHENEPNKNSNLPEENVGLRKDIASLKEKLSEKDKELGETKTLLKQVILHEQNREKVLANAKLKCASDIFEFTMDTAYPHHLNYLLRKARKFTEKYKIPYEFELFEKSVILRHLLLSAKATLNHYQLSNWVDKIESEKVWYQTMDRGIPWEVDFRDYYDKNVVTPAEEDSTEADSAINCGVQVTAAGCINPILWRKTMVKRHVMGIREDSDVLLRYFTETEDSNIYIILSRIKAAVVRLQEETQNVEK